MPKESGSHTALQFVNMHTDDDEVNIGLFEIEYVQNDMRLCRKREI